ncbi:S-layer homology domain-containing protein [Anaerovorax sp. IOR16]|uniref:S-layer homology domain-containing protein n=1 Tax=Anaerovorax sp. IOR16 TaxID=2773458 RepID=UPI0019D2480C|nr:S-layer homology domain-containing protein [Anaerovorax sp. IOR16]
MVHSINDVPSANNDSGSTDEDCSVRVNVRNNDYDVETDTVSLVVQSVTQAAHGTVTNNGDGTVTYLPNANWSGTDNFTYTICDSDNGTATAIVTIKVNPINDTPTAPFNLIMDSLSPYKGGESVIVSWNGAFDADEDNLSYELDYYDGTDWNNIGKNITETSKAFIIPTVDIKKAKMRIRSYDGKVWSIDYKESNEFEIDSTKPQVSLSVDSSDWTSADITVNFITEDKEGSGIADTKYCYAKALNDTTWSPWNAYTSGDYISFIEDGIYKLKVKTIDNAGNVSNEIESRVYKVDKTAPISFIIHTVIDSTTQITVNGTTTDSNAYSSVVSDLAAEPYDYSIDGAYNGVYEADGSYHFVSLQPNKQYTFKMKAKDQAGNIIQTSEVSKYTKAEDPTGSIAKSCTKDTLNVTLIANSHNAVAPQCQVWITRKDDSFDNIVSSSPYSRELERTFTALPENTKYDLWVKVKNEDGVENPPIKVGTYKTNKVPEIVINSLSNIYKKAGEMIEITGVVSDADNEDVTVSASLNGKEKSINISNTSDGADWSLRWDIDTDSIAEDNYKGLVITAADIQNNQDSMSYTGDIIVDKTSPLAPNITVYGGWSSQNFEVVKIADNDDLGSSKSGVNRIEYMLGGAEETDGFVAYKEEFFIAQEGITQITARVIDNAGNISTETTKTVYIDRTNPEVVPTSVDGPIFTNGKENKTVDWTNTDYSVDMTYADTVGIDKIYYEVTQSIEPPVIYDDFVNENVSYEKDVKTVVKSISINREGENFIHYKIIDLAGNIVTGYSGPYKLDKTVPKIFEINVDSVQAHSITISGETIDSTSNSAIVSGTEAVFYDFSLNSEYNNEYKEQSTYQFTNLLSSNEYVLKMRARDKAGNVIETDEVTVKTKKSKKYQDSNLVEISLDGDKLNHIKEMASINSSNENSVQISIINGSVHELLENDRIEDVISLSTERNSQIIIDGLTGLDIKQMENKNVALEIKNAAASYLLPAKQINIDSIMDKLDNQVSLEEILVQIEISNPSEKEVKRIESTIEQKEYETVGNPVNFEIKCSFRNKTVESSKFNKYVERAIAIPAEIHSDRITTGVRIDEDGSIHHVPTKVVNVNGRYYAKINSLTNSLYTLIWHSVEYSDVKKHWAKDAINDLGSRMVISGVGNGMFKPDRDITRGEFTATIVRALGLKEGTEKNLFSDVKSGDWYCKSIETAYEYSLISGYGDKKFNPKGKITREEAIVILTRAMSLTDLTINIESGEIESILSSFKDYDETSKWAKSSLASCVKVGIVSGNYNKMLTPKDYITRAEVAVTIRKLLQKSELI